MTAHKILIAAAILFFLGYAIWELRNARRVASGPSCGVASPWWCPLGLGSTFDPWGGREAAGDGRATSGPV